MNCIKVESTEAGTDTNDGLYEISMAGGALGLISGENFNDYATSNIM